MKNVKKRILGILPHSIGGRLTVSSILDGFLELGFEVIVFDELKETVFSYFEEFDYIVGYDFSPVKLKIDYELTFPCIAYFSDVIQSKAAGVGYDKYFTYLKNSDINVFYWDKVLAQKEGFNYMPHFVNTKIYKNYLKPSIDVMFAGRLDTDLRLNMYLELNKRLRGLKFSWYAIKKHFDDALLRCKNEVEKNIIKNTYKGFIDNESDMARAINEAKIVYNINSQGVSSLNYRTMQVLSSERLIISDKREELGLFNNIIPVYNNIDDLEKKINYYIKNKEEYEKITKKSREIIKLNHDSRICVQKMLEIAG